MPSVNCPNCDKALRLPETALGKRVRCPGCGQPFAAPRPKAEPEEEPEEIEELEPVSAPKNRSRQKRDDDSPRRVRKKKATTPNGGMSLPIRIAAGVLAFMFVLGAITSLFSGRNPHPTAQAPPQPPPQATPAPNTNSAANLPTAIPPTTPAGVPELGKSRTLEPGVLLHEVAITSGGTNGQLWIYLPEQAPAKLPCVLIAPAGSPLFLGMDLAIDDRKEHVPYVKAGFAVVAYTISGACPNAERASNQVVVSAAAAFKNAGAGVSNGRYALDYALAKVPNIDTSRVYAAGHSSAGTLALLLAENEPRIQGCVAYAAVSDVVSHLAPATPTLSRAIPGFTEFIRNSSPLTHAARLKCPLFLFHANDDTTVPVAQSVRFAAAVQGSNARVKLTRAPNGGHYESMIRQGIPQGISWLKELGPKQ